MRYDYSMVKREQGERRQPTSYRLSRGTLKAIDSIAEKFGASKTWVIEEAVRRLLAWSRREGKR